MKKEYEKPKITIELFPENILIEGFGGSIEIGNGWKPGEETADA